MMATQRDAQDVTLSHYHHGVEAEAVEVPADEAAALLREWNSTAARGWRWGLASYYGSLPLTESNAVRRACGLAEW